MPQDGASEFRKIVQVPVSLELSMLVSEIIPAGVEITQVKVDLSGVVYPNHLRGMFTLSGLPIYDGPLSHDLIDISLKDSACEGGRTMIFLVEPLPTTSKTMEHILSSNIIEITIIGTRRMTMATTKETDEFDVEFTEEWL